MEAWFKYVLLLLFIIHCQYSCIMGSASGNEVQKQSVFCLIRSRSVLGIIGPVLIWKRCSSLGIVNVNRRLFPLHVAPDFVLTFSFD